MANPNLLKGYFSPLLFAHIIEKAAFSIAHIQKLSTCILHGILEIIQRLEVKTYQ
jgi:hypothetical protein